MQVGGSDGPIPGSHPRQSKVTVWAEMAKKSQAKKAESGQVTAEQMGIVGGQGSDGEDVRSASHFGLMFKAFGVVALLGAVAWFFMK